MPQFDVLLLGPYESVAALAASAIELEAEGYQVKVQPVSPKPESFRTFLEKSLPKIRLLRGQTILFQDLAQPADEETLQILIAAIRNLAAKGVRVWMVDHHHRAIVFPWRAVVDAGATVWVSASPSWAFYRPAGRSPLKASRSLGKLNGITHRDPYVIPFLDEGDEEIAAGMVAQANRAFHQIFELVKAGALTGDLSTFRKVGELPPLKATVEYHGNVAVVRSLAWGVGIKELQQLLSTLGPKVHYAVGVIESSGKAMVIALRNWRVVGLPPTSFILGHGSQDIATAVNQGAVVIETSTGTEKMVHQVVNALGRFTPTSVKSGAIENMYELTVRYMNSLNYPRSMTQHGPDHISRVLAYGNTLLGMFGVSDEDTRRLFILALAWHDLGLTDDGTDPEETRERHHIRSAEIIEREWARGHLKKLLYSEEELQMVQRLVIAHRLREPLPAEPNLRWAAAMLRFADALDVTAIRAQQNDWGLSFAELKTSPFWPKGEEGEEELRHWHGHRAIRDVRLEFSPRGFRVEALVNGDGRAEFQLKSLRADGRDFAALLTESDPQFRFDWSSVEVQK